LGYRTFIEAKSTNLAPKLLEGRGLRLIEGEGQPRNHMKAVNIIELDTIIPEGRSTGLPGISRDQVVDICVHIGGPVSRIIEKPDGSRRCSVEPPHKLAHTLENGTTAAVPNRR
jgi:hypothetical protein